MDRSVKGNTVFALFNCLRR